MSKLELLFRQHNYLVVNVDYPSTTKSIHELANQNLPLMINACMKMDAVKVHFVTHSIGGIIIQEYLQNHIIPKLGRIVMLSPPNHGSQAADLLLNNWLYRFITGPAGQELTTGSNSTPNKIKLNKKYDMGVITGTYNFVPFGYYLFNEANDGAVSVSSAKTNAMKAYIEVPVSHPFIMNNALVQFQVVNFIKFGSFKFIKYFDRPRAVSTSTEM